MKLSHLSSAVVNRRKGNLGICTSFCHLQCLEKEKETAGVLSNTQYRKTRTADDGGVMTAEEKKNKTIFTEQG